MKLKIAFIGDPLLNLKMEGDSSLSLAKAAIQLKAQVFWLNSDSLNFVSGTLTTKELTIIEGISQKNIDFKSLENQKEVSISEFDFVFLRKDPPFDENYRDMCWFLAHANLKNVFNNPEKLLAYPEKLFHYKALHEGFLEAHELIPTCISSNKEVVLSFLEEYLKTETSFLSKPFLGFGGRGIRRHSSPKEVLDFLQKESPHKYLLQPFLKEIYSEGDHRVFFVNGELVCHFTRYPQGGMLASNLAQGGKAQLKTLSKNQIDICKRLGAFLKKEGIHIAGCDLIGEYVSEINITSPTGLKTFENLSGEDVSLKSIKILLECL